MICCLMSSLILSNASVRQINLLACELLKKYELEAEQVWKLVIILLEEDFTWQ